MTGAYGEPELGQALAMPLLPTEAPGRHAERTPLEQGLHEAEEATLAELELAAYLLRMAIGAVTSGDRATAERVEAGAKEAERRYGEVHERILGLIARQSPVAGDLRLALALLHMNDRISRMAAQCTNIATLYLAISADEQTSKRQLDCLAEMGRLADDQLVEARRVFVERDVEAAAGLREHDQAINAHNRSCFAIAVEEGGNESRREAAFFIALMARAVERLGDNVVDIGQQVRFAVAGQRPTGF